MAHWCPFCLTARRSPYSTGLVCDDRVETRKCKHTAFQRQLRLAREAVARSKMLHARSVSNREGTRRRQQELMDLSLRSGQLSSQSHMASRHMRRAGKANTTGKPRKDEEEAAAALKRFDDAMWEAADRSHRSARPT